MPFFPPLPAPTLPALPALVISAPPVPEAAIPQRPIFPPWAEALPSHATDPGDNQEWEPGFGGLPLLSEHTAGPSSGLMVSLATGDETYLPEPDMISPNPQGSDTLFARGYRSDLARKGYGSPGLSPGWVHNFDLAIVGTEGRWGPLNLVYPNGAADRFVPVIDTAGKPTGQFTSSSGIAAILAGTPSPDKPGHWLHLTITWQDESVWRFEPPAQTRSPFPYSRLPEGGSGNIYLPTRFQELRIEWDARRRIRSVRAESDKALLTFDYSETSGLLTQITDAGKRRIDYGYKPRPSSAKPASGKAVVKSSGQPILAWLSQVYLVGTKPEAPHRVGYDYLAEPSTNVPLLETIRVPHPEAARGSLSVVSSKIVYDRGRVVAHVDANDAQHRFSYKSLGTQVNVQDPSGNTQLSTAFTIDTLGRLRAIKDAKGGTTSLNYGPNGQSKDDEAIRASALSVVPVAPAPYVPPANVPSAARPTTPGQYTFTSIAEVDFSKVMPNQGTTGNVSASKTGLPAPNQLMSIDGFSLNNRGMVAIRGTIAQQNRYGKADVFLLWDGKRLNRLATADPEVEVPQWGATPVAKKSNGKTGFARFVESGGFALCDDGSLVFGADHDKFENGIFRMRLGQPAVCLAGRRGDVPVKLFSFSRIIVNSAGDICFYGALSNGEEFFVPPDPLTRTSPPPPPPPPTEETTNIGTFVLEKGHLRSVDDVVHATGAKGILSIDLADFGNNGDVLVNTSTSMSYTDRSYIVGRSGVRLVAESDNTYNNVKAKSLLPDGSVVFEAELRGDPRLFYSLTSNPRNIVKGKGLYHWQNGQTTKLLESDPFRFTWGESMVDAKTKSVVFRGSRIFFVNGVRQGESPLFTGTDPIRDRLIGPGDTIFGSKIRTIDEPGGRLNENGQFVFTANLENNKMVVVLASPVHNSQGTVTPKPAGTAKAKLKRTK